jgi:uncharacterized protein YjiS (DUF1127 family)
MRLVKRVIGADAEKPGISPVQLVENVNRWVGMRRSRG